MNEYIQKQIAQVSERILVLAEADGMFPTRLDEVRKVAGIRELLDISELPGDITAKRPGFFRRLLGALVFRTETALVDLSLPDGRLRFTEGHEIGHKIIPWHRESFYVDDETTLTPSTREMLEQEANYAAARLLFQGHRFHERALEYATSINTPVALAPSFGASRHAAIWYYVEHHPEPLAAMITGCYGSNLPIWNYIYSPSFLLRFGELQGNFPGQWVSLNENTPYSEVARSALYTQDVPQARIQITDLSGVQRRFSLEAFSNRRCLFFMLSPRPIMRRGRRFEVVTAGR